MPCVFPCCLIFLSITSSISTGYYLWFCSHIHTTLLQPPMSASEGLVSFGFYCFGFVSGIAIPLLHRKWMEYRDKQKAEQQPGLPLVRDRPASPRPSTWVRNNGPATPYRELDSRDPRYQAWHANMAPSKSQ
jgi:hypothetical protein